MNSGEGAHGPTPLRFAILGCGAIAVNHLRALQSLPGVVVAAVIDADLGRAQRFAQAAGVPAAFDDVERGLASGLDAVTVCTPHGAHDAGVRAAASHGLHVLCEKPMAASLAEADRMIDATDAAGVKLGVVLQRRLWPAARRVRAALDSGALGQPIVGSCLVRLRRDAEYYAEPWRGRWDTEGGGALMTQAIHHIDLLQWFMGDAASVTGRIGTLRHGDHIEVEDTAVATIEFVSGALAVVQASTTFAPGLGAQIVVSDVQGKTAGVLEYPEGTGAIDVWTVDEPFEFTSPMVLDGASDPPLSVVHMRLADLHTQQLADFVEAIRENRDPAVTGREGRKALRIIAAIYESSRTGVTVRLANTTSRPRR
jgi:UDP-N-acetyl-2-amino-2-deoxyglucuronate dehydrogenase